MTSAPTTASKVADGKIKIGFIPLTDAAALIAAVALGLDIRHGVCVELSRENSWASLRDKLLTGVIDGAHILAPLAMAMHVGAGQIRKPLIAPVRLSLDGNTIVFSRPLQAALEAQGYTGGANELPLKFAAAASQIAAGRSEPLTLATVFTQSSHHALMRKLVHAAGLQEDENVRLIVLPPSLMVEALENGVIDGFCAGAPWGSLAVERQAGCIAAASSQFGSGKTEKLLVFPRERFQQNSEKFEALCAAVIEAGRWCADPDHFNELAGILSKPGFLGVDAKLILRSLSGRLVRKAGEQAEFVPHFIGLGGNSVARPDRGHTQQIISEMGAAPADFDMHAAADMLDVSLVDRLAAQPLPESQ